MTRFKKITDKQLEKINIRLWRVGSCLLGMTALFQQVGNDPCFNGEEIYGIGQLLKPLSEEVSTLYNHLENGHYEPEEDKEDEIDED